MGGGRGRTVGCAPAPLRSGTRVAAGAAGGGIAPGACGVQNSKPLTVEADLLTTLLTKVTGATFRDDKESFWVEAALPRVRIRCQPEQRRPCQDNADRGTREDACPLLGVDGRSGGGVGATEGAMVNGDWSAVDEHGKSFAGPGWSGQDTASDPALGGFVEDSWRALSRSRIIWDALR
jgi:hypothetical protein